MGNGLSGKRGRKIGGGFSLVELLVVISIVALLISLIMPSFGKARETAKLVQCRSNLHQLSVATSVYVADFKQVVPSSFRAALVADPLNKYLSQTNLTQKGCPGKGGVGMDTAANWSYTISDSFRFDTVGWPYWGPIRMEKVKKPSQSILGLDCAVQTNYSPTHYETQTLSDGRHAGEGLNFVFPDGHTEYLKGGPKDATNFYPQAEWRFRFPSHNSPQSVTTTPYCGTLYNGCFWHPI